MCGFNKKIIKEQVLSIHQVKELQELGFDVRKYATLAVIEAKDGNHYIVDRRLLSINMGFMETEVIEYFETLSIGDIMDILPETILIDREDGVLFCNNTLQTDMRCYLRYASISTIIEIKRNEKFINMLFDLLKWCIKNKHIQCQ